VTELNGFTYEQLDAMFTYDHDTGILIRRRTTASNAQAGRAAGSLDGKGYLHVSIQKTFVRVHRIAYFLLHGTVPPVVDHIDGNKTNNRPGNLRAATQAQNVRNAGLSAKNTSGLKGVSQNSRSGKWHAQIKVNGKQTYLGRFDCPKAAAVAYNTAASQHFGEFAKLNHVDEL
jgi:hypothetical protein